MQNKIYTHVPKSEVYPRHKYNTLDHALAVSNLSQELTVSSQPEEKKEVVTNSNVEFCNLVKGMFNLNAETLSAHNVKIFYFLD